MSEYHNPHAGNCTVRFFEGNTYVGERKHYACGFSDGKRSGQGYWPHIAYFCPTCGEIWARAIYSFDFDYKPLAFGVWHSETHLCPKHGPGFLLRADMPAHILRECSIELLAREALRACLTL